MKSGDLMARVALGIAATLFLLALDLEVFAPLPAAAQPPTGAKIAKPKNGISSVSAPSNKQPGLNKKTVEQLLDEIRALRQRAEYKKIPPLLAEAKKLAPSESIDLAQVLRAEGMNFTDRELYEKAEAPLTRSKAIFEKLSGSDSISAGALANDLGALYYFLGRNSDAEKSYQQALQVRESKLGPEDIDVAQTLNNIAWLKMDQQKYEEAKPLFERAIRIARKASPDSSGTRELSSYLFGLGQLLADQERYREALPILQESVIVAEKSFGPTHPETKRYRELADEIKAEVE